MTEIGIKETAALLEALRVELGAASLTGYWETPNGVVRIIVHPFGMWVVAGDDQIPGTVQ